MSVLQDAKDLHGMATSGQAMEALDKYYADDVVIVEGDGSTRNGKEEQRAAVQQWMGMVSEIHGGGVESMAADEEAGVVFKETWIEATFAQGGRAKLEQVAVQRWKDGKVVHERFYHNFMSGN